MIKDKMLNFSESQAITAAAASTNTLDMSQANRDIGTGETLFLAISIEVAFTDSGSDSTLTVAIQGDSTDTFTPDATYDVFTFPALSPVGVHYFPLAPGLSVLSYRYLRLYYTPNSGNLSTGTISASLVHGIQKATLYPDGFTIS